MLSKMFLFINVLRLVIVSLTCPKYDSEKITVIWDVELCGLVEMYLSSVELVVNVFLSA
jgi:hypothetical protein